MTDFLRVSPGEDGLVAAMSAARARRYRKAGVSTGFAAALSCLALVAGSAGTQTLIQEPRPELPAVTGVDQLEQTDTVTTPGRNTAGALSVATATGPDNAAAAGPVAAQGPGQIQDSTYDKPLLPRAETPYRAGPMKRDDNYITAPPIDCDVEESTQRQLCTSVSIAQGAKGVWHMQAQICSTRTYETRLTYAQRNELDFVVTANGEEYWRWSAWHPRVDAPHTLALETGSCTFWSFDWSGVGFDGTKLPKGDYYLKARYLADELTARPVALTTFTTG